MAGNIIPAIATTNAITAGLCVLQAFKVLREDYKSARMVFLSRSADRAFSAEKLSPPNPGCEICGVARTGIEADITRATLGDLVEKVLRGALGYGEEVCVLVGQALLFDADFDDNLETPLCDLGFGEETFVTVKDEGEEEEEGTRINLVIAVTNTIFTEDEAAMTIPEPFQVPRKPKASEAVEVNGLANGVKRGHDEVMGGMNGHASKRRKVDIVVGSGEGAAMKKAKVFEGKGPAEEDVILLDDDGCITID